MYIITRKTIPVVVQTIFTVILLFLVTGCFSEPTPVNEKRTGIVHLFNQDLNNYVDEDIFPSKTENIDANIKTLVYQKENPKALSKVEYIKISEKKKPIYRIKLDYPMKLTDIKIEFFNKFKVSGEEIFLEPHDLTLCLNKKCTKYGSFSEYSPMNLYSKKMPLKFSKRRYKEEPTYKHSKSDDGEWRTTQRLYTPKEFINKEIREIYISMNWFRKVDLSDIKNSKNKITFSMPKIDIYIDGKHNTIYDVVLKNLKRRDDKSLNEELVREVGKKDIKLFRIIQKNAKKFKLPKKSIAFLPLDVSVHYALKNQDSILKTGKYLSFKGDYKYIKKKSVVKKSVVKKIKIKATSQKEKVTHKIKVAGEEVTIKKSSVSYKKAEFLDFSQGL
jgi:hypothetical protein